MTLRPTRRAPRPTRLALAAASLAAAATPAFAQSGPEGDPSTGGRTAPPQRVEIRARAVDDTELRRREPVAKTVVGREEIDKHGDTNVNDVLKRLPGVTIAGGNARMRGLGGGYTQILVNGEPAPPGFTLDNLAPNQVERIEITKGPTADQSAQAVAGTINIVLRRAGGQRYREASAGFGFMGSRDPSVRGGLVVTDKVGELAFTLPLFAYRWRGGTTAVALRDTRDAAGAPQSFRVDTRERWWGGGINLAPRLTWKLGDAWTVESSSFVVQNHYRSATDGLYGALAGSAPRSATEQGFNGGHWNSWRSGLQATWRGDSGARFEAGVGAQGVDNAWTTTVDAQTAAGAANVQRVTTGAVDEAQRSTKGKLQWPVGEAHTFAAGWDAEWKDRTDRRTVTEFGVTALAGFDGKPLEARIERQAGYVQDEWAITDQWGVYLGVRSERIALRSTDAAGAEVRSGSRVTTPVLHTTYRFDAKGRDILRASLTRAYKAPDVNALLARPSFAANQSIDGTNTLVQPDTVGNPALKPELSTGVDVAFETYFAEDSMLSVGAFHRRLTDVVRRRTTLETVPWSTQPRWVSRPVNLDGATSSGLELEWKGKPGALLPSLGLPKTTNVRVAFNRYWSSVDGIAGPDNRLEQQPPWLATLGFDHRWAGLPLSYGATLAWTPGYRTRASDTQTTTVGAVRALDLQARWDFSRATSLRLQANNAWALPGASRTLIDEPAPWNGVQRVETSRRQPAMWGLQLTHRF